jgi:diguanylate cyclase (GGDEF)-like protein/PAS domain S-box-containing protein
VRWYAELLLVFAAAVGRIPGVTMTSSALNTINSRAPDSPALGAHQTAAVAALLTFICCLGLSIVVWYSVDEIENRNAAMRFNARVQQATFQLRSRLSGYEKILRGAVGLLRASHGVTRHEWGIFVESLNLDADYPGIQGIGYAVRIYPGELDAHVESIRVEGFPDYKVWPPGPRMNYTAIVYLEPFGGRNVRAFGYDMLSDPVRQQAMQHAWDTGKPSMTGKVTLVQETDQDVQAGFLIYLPYYGEGNQPAGLAERRTALLGFVYAPFRMNDLINGVFQGDFRDVELAIYDGSESSASNLLFSSSTEETLASAAPRFTASTTLDLYGRTWSIYAASTAAFRDGTDGSRARYILWACVLISLLVSGIVWSLVMNRYRAGALANAKLRYQQVVESITDAFFTCDTNWCITYVSPRAEALLRKASCELLDRNLWQAFPEAIGTVFELETKRALEERVETQYVDYYGPPLETWFDVHVYPHSGGVSVFFRDVTRGKQSEEALRLRERAVESSVNAILITDARQPDNPIIYVNPAFERITGYSAAEAIGRNCRFLQHNDQEQPELEKVRAIIRDQREGHAVLRNYRKNGEIFWNELYIAPVKDDRGAVTHFVGVQNDITESKTYQEQLERQATHDALTGLVNRAVLRDRIAQAVAHAGRNHSRMALLFIDLDNFKLINDSLGHDAGDEVLRLMAQRLSCNVRQDDTVARLGGDEFVIVLNDNRSVEDIAQVADRICDLVSKPFHMQGRETVLTCSAGISVCPDDGSEPDMLLKNADLAMYKAKESGRNSTHFYAAGMNEAVLQRLELTNSLRQALGREEFVLHFQPQFDLASKALVGFEVLLRWQHRELGLISPMQFIPLAEESGLIVPIGEWVIRAACEFYRDLKELDLPPLVMSVNLSARQLRHQNLVMVVQNALQESSVPAEFLEFEVTESMVMHDVEEVLKIFSALKAIGVKLAMDDFGTGYSSLSYLKRFPIDRLKIDRSFVRDITFDANDAAIAKSIVSLAHTLDIKVVAEGVEAEEQLQILRQFKCDEGQGYYFGKPLPGADFRERLRRFSGSSRTERSVKCSGHDSTLGI